MAVKLTKSVVDRAAYEGTQYPNGSWSRCVLWDSQTPGFGVRIVPSGKKFFIFNYRAAGRSKLITVGQYGPLTVEAARAKANEYVGQIDLHRRDPLEERREEHKLDRSRITIGVLCDKYIERYAKREKRSWRKDVRRIERFIVPAWGSRPVDTITRKDVGDLHETIGADSGPYEANRTLEVVRKMFNLAVEWGHLPEGAPNPAWRFKRFPEERRERWATSQEMPRLTAAIDGADSPYVRAALWLYLLTGVRRNELLQAEWDDVDFENRQLRIPIGHLKNRNAKAPQYVNLSSEALAILCGIPRLEGNAHILPGKKQGEHLVNLDRQWRRVRATAGCSDLRLHDLRRTVGSMLASSGVPLLVIQKALGHATPVATQVYARIADDPVRQAVDAHGKRLMAIAGKREAGEVIGFDEARSREFGKGSR